MRKQYQQQLFIHFSTLMVAEPLHWYKHSVHLSCFGHLHPQITGDYANTVALDVWFINRFGVLLAAWQNQSLYFLAHFHRLTFVGICF